MTMELLERILKENSIPEDVHFVSDSGWECSETEMDGVYYNRETNVIVFTQGGISDKYTDLKEWEILYSPDLIKIDELEVYPAAGTRSYELTDEFIYAIKDAGDFKQYYGVSESEDKYEKIDLNKPLFYSIKIRNEYIGYIGFVGDGDTLEPEMYIFEKYRNKGYGTAVLKRFINIAFKDGLLKEWKEKNIENRKPVFRHKKEMVFPSRFISTVRTDNEYSKRMMLTCGFKENRETAAEFLVFPDDNSNELIGVTGFELTKSDYSFYSDSSISIGES